MAILFFDNRFPFRTEISTRWIFSSARTRKTISSPISESSEFVWRSTTRCSRRTDWIIVNNANPSDCGCSPLSRSLSLFPSSSADENWFQSKLRTEGFIRFHRRTFSFVSIGETLSVSKRNLFRQDIDCQARKPLQSTKIKPFVTVPHFASRINATREARITPPQTENKAEGKNSFD